MRAEEQIGLSGLPPIEERGDIAGVHVAHVLELAGLLRVEQLAVGVEDGERGNALLDRDVVLLRDVEVLSMWPM